jgi:transposase
MTGSSHGLLLDFEEEWELKKEVVQAAWEAEVAAPADGRKARLSAVAKRTGISKRMVKRALSSDPSDLAPPPQGPGRPRTLTPRDMFYLLQLCDEGNCHTDDDYIRCLYRGTGTVASLSTVQRFLTNELVSSYKNIEYTSSDKWTEKNLLRLRLFELAMSHEEEEDDDKQRAQARLRFRHHQHPLQCSRSLDEDVLVDDAERAGND